MENINPPPFEPPIIQEPDRFAGGDSLHVERRFRDVFFGSLLGFGDADVPVFVVVPVFGDIPTEEEEIAEDPLVPLVHDPRQNVDQYMDFEFVSSDSEEESDSDEELRAQSPLESHVAAAPVAVAAVEEEPLRSSEHLLTELSRATPSSAQGSKKRSREDDSEGSTSKKGCSETKNVSKKRSREEDDCEDAAKKSRAEEEAVPGTSAGTSRPAASSTSFFRPMYWAESDSDSESD